jgi:hypothetical protein
MYGRFIKDKESHTKFECATEQDRGPDSGISYSGWNCLNEKKLSEP